MTPSYAVLVPLDFRPQTKQNVLFVLIATQKLESFESPDLISSTKCCMVRARKTLQMLDHFHSSNSSTIWQLQHLCTPQTVVQLTFCLLIDNHDLCFPSEFKAPVRQESLYLLKENVSHGLQCSICLSFLLKLG